MTSQRGSLLIRMLMSLQRKPIFWYVKATQHGGGGEAENGIPTGRHMSPLTMGTRGKDTLKFLISVLLFTAKRTSSLQIYLYFIQMEGR